MARRGGSNQSWRGRARGLAPAVIPGACPKLLKVTIAPAVLAAAGMER
jgi:hypothetical protein